MSESKEIARKALLRADKIKSRRRRNIANAILIQNSWLFSANPALAMYLKLL